MKKRFVVVILAVVVVFGLSFLAYNIGKNYDTGNDDYENIVSKIKGKTLSGKQLLSEIEDTLSVADIEQEIMDGVVISIDKSILDTDTYEIIDVVLLEDNKIKLIVRNKTVEITPDVPEDTVRAYGDVYFDGEVDVKDMILLLRYASLVETVSEEDFFYADLNVDGLVDNTDVIILGRHLIGQIGYETLPLSDVDLKLVYGDVNVDGTVNGLDSVKLEKYLNGSETIDTEGRLNADLDLDGEVTKADLNILSKYLANYDITLPVKNIKYGDVNIDGAVNGLDSVKLEKYLNGSETIDTVGLFNADLDLDGEVTKADLNILSKYLTKYDITLPVKNIKYGDVNVDGVVNALDSVKLEKYLDGSEKLSTIGLLNADLDLDGKETKADLNILSKYLAKYDITLPVKNIKYGDVNVDGVVNALDSVKLEKYLDGSEKLSTIGLLNADLDLDGKETKADLNILSKYLAKYDITLPVKNIKYGDVNVDGVVNALDSVKLEKYLDGSEKLSAIGLLNADLDLDGKETKADLNILSKYLAKYDITLPLLNVKYGDINLDGVVNSADSDLLKKYFVKSVNLNALQQINADLNADGKLNAIDNIILERHLAKWQGYDKLPVIDSAN